MVRARRWANVGLALVLLRASYESGKGQTARAFVSTASKDYIATFAAPLVVRTNVPPLVRPYPGKRRVTFHCVTKGCTFPPDDTQPDSVHRAQTDDAAWNTAAWDVDISHGHAQVKVTLQVPRVNTAYTIDAYPDPQRGERTQHVRFTVFVR